MTDLERRRYGAQAADALRPYRRDGVLAVVRDRVLPALGLAGLTRCRSAGSGAPHGAG